MNMYPALPEFGLAAREWTVEYLFFISHYSFFIVLVSFFRNLSIDHRTTGDDVLSVLPLSSKWEEKWQLNYDKRELHFIQKTVSNMETIKTYENFPLGVVIQSSLVSLGIYGLGFFIMFRVGMALAWLYLLYILVLEYRLIRYDCINCYYWGRTCGFGKGRLSGLFFPKGEAANFCRKEMAWKDLIPDILVSLIPFVAGIVLLIVQFSWAVLIALAVLVVLTTSGNNYIRGTLTCKHCKQRELGCPAEQLFNKKK
ncbi:hypothetical protein CLV93_10312 [Prolixibacter denitrificans]|uniref:Uncharacterized protein n=2 Tax=Prolixibacter denitrificans TaxID=1541063 RepID=A0A2P8CF28_9BACT|nr:hypothetical protein CLV93_10312 [Prolixibacter denitrificans]GET23146.1 hypothetical protein JCM18694_33920 [Prolixibacter denitrificans]